MKWFHNMKIGPKIVSGFSLVLVIVSVLSIYSTSTASKIDTDYSYIYEYPKARVEAIMEIKYEFESASRALAQMSIATGLDGAETEINARLTQINELVGKMTTQLNDYKRLVTEDPRFTNDEKNDRTTSANDAIAQINKWYNNLVIPQAQANLESDRQKVISLRDEYADLHDNLYTYLDDLAAKANKTLNDMDADISVYAENSILLLIILTVIIIAVSIFIEAYISRSIRKPIARVVKTISEVVKGNLNINIDRASITNDEVGQMTQDVYTLVDVIHSLVRGIEDMSSEYGKGNIDAKINTAQFEGSYRTVAEGINEMTGSYTNETITFLNCLSEFGSGNFDADIPKLPGKKAIMNESLNTLRENLKSVALDINSLVGHASAGTLSARADVNKYKGDWAKLLNSLNQLMAEIAAPIDEAQRVLHQVAVGNFNNKLEGNYKGDFLVIKNSINDMVVNISMYINEISNVLTAMAKDDLNQEISRDYVGKFADIKYALNNIISKLNSIISDIKTAANQVASGAKQVSESSMTLAQGASEQSSSIEELNATIATINESTSSNAKNAKNAENLAKSSKSNAYKGNQDMGKMLASMDGINDSSKNIAKIIKVIDDIAFQTNLLALNAAVEAARAGEHGKGFAIVAEEVRSLAGRSQEAAKETETMIAESISKVSDGSSIAGTTAGALNTIMSDVTSVSDIITEIASASDAQAEAINQISEGISRISSVVQSNSATSEEAASASLELSSQADILRNLVSVFNLK